MIRIYKNRTSESKLQVLKSPHENTWVMVETPSQDELATLSLDYKLDLDMLKDGVDANESPRIDYWQGVTYIYMRYCLPESQKLTTWPLLIVYTKNNLLTISAKSCEALQSFIKGGRVFSTVKHSQLVLQILEEISFGYKKRINLVSKRVWQIRSSLDKQHIDNKNFVSMIDIEEDLGDFLSALEPMIGVLHAISSEKFIELYDDDKDLLEDVTLGIRELITLAESRLRIITNIREAYSTIMANNLNKVFKLMTSITILMSIFTTVTGIYSMNIRLPAAQNPHAFWVILGLTGIAISWVAWMFRKNHWF